MNLKDFNLDGTEATKLLEIDSLVHYGLPRDRAEKLVGQLYDLIDGPWQDILTPLADSVQDDDVALLSTFFVSFVYSWAQDRALVASLVQNRILDKVRRENGHG
jgi:hypothetical protein